MISMVEGSTEQGIVSRPQLKQEMNKVGVESSSGGGSGDDGDDGTSDHQVQQQRHQQQLEDPVACASALSSPGASSPSVPPTTTVVPTAAATSQPPTKRLQRQTFDVSSDNAQGIGGLATDSEVDFDGDVVDHDVDDSNNSSSNDVSTRNHVELDTANETTIKTSRHDTTTTNGTVTTIKTDKTTQEKKQFLFGLISIDELQEEQLKLYLKGAGGVVILMFMVNPGLFLTKIWNLLWTVIGLTLGLGLGAGLGLHVYQQLNAWQQEQDDKKNSINKDANAALRQNVDKKEILNRKLKIIEQIKPHYHPSSITSSTLLEDGNSYFSLLAQAGYPISGPSDDPGGQRVLRGQVIREDHAFWKTQYRFTDEPVPNQRAVKLVQSDWPTLPKAVTTEIGRFIEHVMRDYIAAWYSILDGGLVFRPEREKRAEGIPRDGGGKDDGHQQNLPMSPSNGRGRKMVFSTLTHRRAPMIDSTYRVLSFAFGNLASRAEHMNVVELVALKWTQVLGHTFKVYRSLRKSAQEKSKTDNPSEVQVTREFLLAGKLHRAVIFGLDVPSLLFADAYGEECGCGTEAREGGSSPIGDATRVLEERLYGTNMIRECMLDYNRVVANRLVRALLPKSETASNCVMALVVEIFASSVLQPLMNLWVPSFLNDLVVKAMTSAPPPPPEVVGDIKASNLHDVVDPVIDKGQTAKTLVNTKDRASSVVGAVEAVGASSREISKGSPFVKRRSKSTLSDVDATPSLRSSGDIHHSSESGDVSEFFHEGDDNNGVAEKLLTLSSLALSELSKYMDFDSCRTARLNSQEPGVDWDDADCQSAVLRLVLVIEAVLLQGRTPYRDLSIQSQTGMGSSKKNGSGDSEGNSGAVNARSGENEGKHEELEDRPEKLSFTQVLMEMTSDMAAFEKKIADLKAKNPNPTLCQDPREDDFEPDQSEVHTVRTLISTWLHTGQLYKAIQMICLSSDSLLAHYYTNEAFIVSEDSERFLRQMKKLEGVDILVETMVVLAAGQLDLVEEFDVMDSLAVNDLNTSPPTAAPNPRRGLQNQSVASSDFGHATETLTGSFLGSSLGDQSVPRYLDFRRNEAFAGSMAAERERRMRAWETRKTDTSINSVVRKTATRHEDFELHQEIHHLARLFFNQTMILTIRDAARRTNVDDTNMGAGVNEKVSIMTLEVASARRKVEVPDDDTSFLLRAQARPLNPISVHRDDRNHDLSYKCFSATYEEPAIQPGTQRYNGGRFVRRCLLQYFPSDRTSSIVLQSDERKMDRRKSVARIKSDHGMKDQSTTSPFTPNFLRQRHLCQKWIPKGTTQSFLASNLMEITDFSASPRTGKALDFIYRMCLFESPVVDIGGKRFLVQDSSLVRGVHRADASAMEMSDASLSYLMCTLGKEYEPQSAFPPAETAPDGYPMIFLKRSVKNGDQTSTEIKPYRVSFVRAALLVTSARQDAQLQSLIDCVKAGSAKSQNKARTDERLRPFLKILDYANDRSKDQNKASCLNRDLKLGIYHIDRDQLRRNGLVSPRYPTSIIQLGAKIESAASAKDVPIAKLVSGKMPPDTTLYKIRCAAVVELVDVEESGHELDPYTLDDGSLATLYREEWVVYRSLQDFQALHKQLKSQVASTESTMSTSTRLVGAASAALGSKQLGRRNKMILIPSLAQATKVGALTSTKKTIERRMELLDEYVGYLLGNNSLMNRNAELLLFLGASHPFPSEVTVTKAPANFVDPLGRMNFIRSVALRNTGGVSKLKKRFSSKKRTEVSASASSLPDTSSKSDADNSSSLMQEPQLDTSNMDPMILSKVDQIPLAEVRNRLFELMRHVFGFENASFVRGQLLTMLETASFVAMTQKNGFRKVLYDFHVQRLNGDAVGGIVRALLDLLWPDGVWGTHPPPLTIEEEAALQVLSLQKLREGFPDQIRAIFGKELTREGLDMIHEMLQNRIVVKSLFYMLFDLVWIEIFPELRDSLPCASAIDLDLL